MKDKNWKNAPRSDVNGLFRVHGFTHDPQLPMRVWIGTCEDAVLTENSILKLRSAGNRYQAEAYASDLKFS